MGYTIFGDKMKQRIKKIVGPIFLSVLCGFICGKLVYSIYDDEASNILNSNRVYLIEAGSYQDYSTMVSQTALSNYIYYEDEGSFKTVVGITKKEENIEKIRKAYGDNTIVSEYLINNDEINFLVENCDKEINNTEDLEKVKDLSLEIINAYNKQEDIKMTKIS